MTALALTRLIEPGEARAGQRILIVEDDARMRTSLRLLLDGPGRKIVEVGNGSTAIGILEMEHVDLVLLDIGLPDMSGVDVMKWIVTHRIDTSVMIVSGDDRFDVAVRALRFGAVEFVRKPDDLDDLPAKVDNTLQRRRLKAEHALMTARLEQSERLHRFLIDNSPDIVYTLDQRGHFTFINRRIESLLGFDPEALIGQHYATVVHEDDRDLARHVLNERRTDSRASSNIELRLKQNGDVHATREKHFIVTMVSAIGLYAESGADQVRGQRFVGSYGVARDITERKMAEETISFQALHDQLTQLPNRRLFKDHLELAMAQAERYAAMVGVMFIDLDRFKLVNDTHGHLEGDELLINFAKRLRNCVRAGDTVARQGGDEFTVLLPEIGQAEDATTIANKILEELRAPFQVGGQDFLATASIGISLYPRDGDNADLLLKNADIAMYEVKANGKNAFQQFAPEMSLIYQERIELENDLRRAINNAEFVLHFQPRISVSHDRVVGVEALIRWQHPTQGLLHPSGFIGLAEASGLICAISDWVLDDACARLARWQRAGHSEIRMSVNLSPLDFQRDDLVERIASRVASFGLPPDMLEIEITENLLLQDIPDVIEKLRQLRSRGVRIAIDDFGTRYSSLNYLRRFPINSIKIDQSFVRDIFAEERVSPIIQAIVGIARGFGLHLVAEGVETPFQQQVLAEQGCDEMQGFLYAAPLPAVAVEAMFGCSIAALAASRHESIAKSA